MTSRLSSSVMIGRADEQERLAAALRDALAGRPSIRLVAGEAGIGKTRLVAEHAAVARAHGALVLEGGGVDLSGTSLPFGPIVEALRALELAKDSRVAEISSQAHGTPIDLLVGRAAPDVAGQASSLANGTIAQAQLFEAVFRLLARLGDVRPVVLVVEDLHWVDRSTLDLLAFLARNARAQRLELIGTVRSDELRPTHPLTSWLAEVERHPGAERLELRRFDRVQQAEQLEAIVRASVSEAVVDLIHGRSDGNPFIAEELLALAWLPTGSEPAADAIADGLPDTIAAALGARVAALPDASQSVLRIASVAGRQVTHDVLVSVSGRPEEDVEDALRESVRAHFIVAHDDGDPAYAFRHALGREAVYRDLLPSERRRLHRRYAEVLAAMPLPSGAEGASHQTQIAHHWAAAGAHAAALSAWVRAADLATATYAFADAADHLQQALGLWDRVPAAERPPGIDEVELLSRTAYAVGLTSHPGPAVGFLRRAVDALDVRQEPERAAQLMTRLGRMQFHTGDLQSAVASQEQAVGYLDPAIDSRTRAEALAGLAGTLMVAAAVERATPIAQDAVALARRVGARRVEGNALCTLGACLSMAGERLQAVDRLEEALAIAEELDDPLELVRTHINLQQGLADAGMTARAIETAMRGRTIAIAHGAWGHIGRE